MNTWLSKTRDEAAKRFATLGLPSTHDEDWKYTSLLNFKRHTFTPATPSSDLAWSNKFADKEGSTLVFVDGFFSKDLSQIKLSSAIEVRPLSDVLNKTPELVQFFLENENSNTSLVAQNLAQAKEGAFIKIKKSDERQTVHLIFIGNQSGVSRFARNIIVAETHSQTDLIEEYTGLEEKGSYTNVVNQVYLQRGANLTHYKIQNESLESFHFGFTFVSQERDSQYVSHNFSFGAALARNDFQITLGEEGARCELQGLYAVSGKQHVDNHTVVDHATPHCQSLEVYKGILGDHSHGVFDGKILVRKNAVKTDSMQLNRNLLLTETAGVDSKPQLEIHNDDVKCSHGAAIGQLDNAQVFYMQSRGIPEDEARKLLTRAFAAEQLEKIPLLHLRKHVEDLLDGKGLV